MSIKSIGLLAAAMAMIVVTQPAEAKHNKNWQNGASCNTGYNTGYNTGIVPPAYQNAYNSNGRPFLGWNNNFGNNNGWNNNFGNNNGWNNNNGRFGAHLSANGIDQVQTRLNTRIQRGITTGRLTQSEASRLLSMQNRINQLETQYRLSGNSLSWSERSKLNNELSKLSQRLQRELTDRQIM